MKGKRTLKSLIPLAAALAFEGGFAVALAALSRSIGAPSIDVAYLASVEAGVAALFLAAAWLALRREERRLEAAGRDPLGSGLPESGLPGAGAWRDFAERVRRKADEEVAARDERARADLDSFLDTVHALKTPATALSLMAERAQSQGEALKPDELRLELDELNLILDRAIGRQRLADFERGSRLGRVDCGELARAGVKKLRRLFMARGIGVGVEGGLVLTSDGEWISFILGELLSNAAKYARSSVRVELSSRGGEGQIEVGDDGPGLDEEDGAAAFGRSSSLSAGRRGAASGEGLPASSGYGLYLAREAARRIGGRLEIGRDREGGARLRLSLPLPLDPRGQA
jgi:signal transduction histidine kinase